MLGCVFLSLSLSARPMTWTHRHCRTGRSNVIEPIPHPTIVETCLKELIIPGVKCVCVCVLRDAKGLYLPGKRRHQSSSIIENTAAMVDTRNGTLVIL